MNNLVFSDGGRPLQNDDLELLQSETYYAIFGQFMNLPPCVVAGVEVAAQGAGRFNLNAGLIFIEAGLYRFDGASNVTLPLELRLGAAVLTDPRPYETGGSIACFSERKLEAQAVSATPGSKVLVTADGVLRFEKAREAVLRSRGEVSFLTVLADEYDINGRGRYGTRAYGWQLMNGKNGAIDFGGRFLAGYAGAGSAAANQVEYNAPKKTGGLKEVTLTVDQMPAHAHGMDQAGEHTHGIDSRAGDGSNNVARRGNQNGNDGAVKTQSAGNHTHGIQNTGGNQAHENRPPFTVFVGREWVGLG